MRYEKFVMLENGDFVRINFDGKIINVEIKAINRRRKRAFVSLEPGGGDSYRAIWISYKEILDEGAGDAA